MMNRTALPGRYILGLLAALALTADIHGEVHPLWGKLQPGKYGVGFQSRWEFDYARTYRLNLDGKAGATAEKQPRPILVNLWYPTAAAEAGPRMPHRSYLEIASQDPRVSLFAEELIKYNHNTIAQEICGKPLAELSPEQRKLLGELLDSPTACLRGAAPAAGKFPLVIYHAGHGSSFEDNAVLCEYLASHGFVVVGSAFQWPDGTSFNVDGKATSARDMGFLCGIARQLPFVDWQHIGVVGHSGGAHAAWTFRSEANCVVDAMVSLDTTQDYYSGADPRWAPMTEAVAKGKHNFTGPLLVVANPHAIFSMVEPLVRSHRSYLTLKNLGHNDFIVQGCLSRELKAKLPPVATTDKDAKTPPAEVRASYEALCRSVLCFFEAHLKGERAGWDALAAQYAKTPLGGSAPHLEQVPPGVTGPPLYPEGTALLPTPRQLRPYLREHGAAKTIALLQRVHKVQPKSPLFETIFAFALVYDLLEEGKTADAKTLTAYYHEVVPDFRDIFRSFGAFFFKIDRPAYALDCYKKALALDPGNAELVKKVKEAEERERK